MTRGAIAALIAAVAILATGRILGIAEFVGLGIGWILLLAIAFVWTRVRKDAHHCHRRINPGTVYVNEDFEIQVTVTNPTRRATGLVQLIDPVVQPGQDALHASLGIPPLAPGEQWTNSFSLRANVRGPMRIGPMTATSTDPCGLIRRTRQIVAPTEVLVLPMIEQVSAPWFWVGESERVGAARPTLSGTEFVSLREYISGDDPRKVHWPSSAKLDSLVVKIDESPLDRFCVAVLDDRSSVHDASSFERAISACASVLVAAKNDGMQLQLMTSSGFRSGGGSTNTQLTPALHHLARIDLQSTTDVVVFTERQPVVLFTTSRGCASFQDVPTGSKFVVFGTPPAAWQAPMDVDVIEVSASHSFARAWGEHQ